MSAQGVIAIIPARGGSKRLPRKNLLSLGGKPLIAHTIEQARAARSVASVYVSTDAPEIAAVAERYGAEVIERPAALASDTATSESVLVHALDQRMAQGLADPGLVVFLQCTCPMRGTDDIDRAVATLREQGADSLFSACRETPFIWRDGPEGLRSFTYDYRARKRTQDWPPYFRENGSIYVFRPWVLRTENNRLGGKIAVHEMSPAFSFDVDDEADFRLLQMILENEPGLAPAPD